MKHEWRSVEGFPGYEVSSEGWVRSLPRRNLQGAMRRGRVLKQDTARGYKLVRLARDGKKQARTVHSLVLTAFKGPRRSGLEARHLNGVRGDNRAVNLEWGTTKENRADQKAHGTGVQGGNNPKAFLAAVDVERVSDLRRAGYSQQKIAEWVGCDQTTVSKLLHGKHWTQQLSV